MNSGPVKLLPQLPSVIMKSPPGLSLMPEMVTGTKKSDDHGSKDFRTPSECAIEQIVKHVLPDAIESPPAVSAILAIVFLCGRELESRGTRRARY